MAAFSDSFSVCGYCFMGSCNASERLDSADNVSFHPFCQCQPGFVHDDVFFHDPICSLPEKAKLVWLIVDTVVTTMLLIILWRNSAFRMEFCQPFSSTLQLSGHGSSSTAGSFRMNASSPRPSIARDKTANEKHRVQLSILVITIVLLSFLYVLVVFVENRAGIVANVLYCILSLCGLAYLDVLVQYIVKPLFRLAGRARFQRMLRINRLLLAFFAVSFIALTIILATQNNPQDLDDPSLGIHRIRYNMIASFVAMWSTMFGLSSGCVVSYHVTKLIHKIQSMPSFRNGDILMVANYARLVKVRKRIWSVTLNMMGGGFWAIIQWSIGVTPFFWVFFISSFIFGPITITWFQYTLTHKGTSPNEQYLHQQDNNGENDDPIPVSESGSKKKSNNDATSCVHAEEMTVQDANNDFRLLRYRSRQVPGGGNEIEGQPTARKDVEMQEISLASPVIVRSEDRQDRATNQELYLQ